LFFPINVLELKFNGDVVSCIPIFYNLNLEVDYTHSVSLTKVIDSYIVNNSGIYAYKTEWQDFEAGQPLDGRFENGFLMKKINMYLGKHWEYWFIPLNNVSVKIGGKVIFSNCKEDGILAFDISKIPLGLFILRWCG